MTEIDKKKIKEIMDGMECRKDFKCAESGFEKLCRAEDIGIEGFLICLEEKNNTCNFAFSFGNKIFCNCPLRVYLGKKLKKIQ